MYSETHASTHPTHTAKSRSTRVAPGCWRQACPPRRGPRGERCGQRVPPGAAGRRCLRVWFACAGYQCPSLFTAALTRTRNSSRQDFKQREKEKNAVLLFFLLLFFFSVCFSSALLPAASAAGLQRDGHSLVEITKSNFAARRAPQTAVRRGRRAFASREEKEQKPGDARAVLNRCLPNREGIVRLCVVAGWEEAGGRGDGERPPSHAGRPQPQSEVSA